MSTDLHISISGEHVFRKGLQYSVPNSFMKRGILVQLHNCNSIQLCPISVIPILIGVLTNMHLVSGWEDKLIGRRNGETITNHQSQMSSARLLAAYSFIQCRVRVRVMHRVRVSQLLTQPLYQESQGDKRQSLIRPLYQEGQADKQQDKTTQILKS